MLYMDYPQGMLTRTYPRERDSRPPNDSAPGTVDPKLCKERTPWEKFE